MKQLLAVCLVMAVSSCASTQDRFEAMMVSSREGHDSQTMVLASELLADPAVAPIVKARTEMTVALVHIRAKQEKEAQAALARAKALGIESDTGYFRDHLAEYEQWIREQ